MTRGEKHSLCSLCKAPKHQQSIQTLNYKVHLKIEPFQWVFPLKLICIFFVEIILEH